MRILYSLLLLAFSVVAFSQKMEKVTAAYTYYAPENVSKADAMRIALERAKITAIADAFGTIVTQSNTNVISVQNGKTDERFFSLGGSEVRGEWIETLNEPVYDIRYEGDMLVVSVEVTGRIREILGAGIDFTAKVLRNGVEEKFVSSEFRSGDDLFLYFKSPVDGYLTVYLLDETSGDVFCLLPYRTSGEGAYRIEHDKPYVLFSSKHEANNPGEVDEYNMTCNGDKEYNDVYVIFSPNPFAKANANESMSDVLPRQLSFEDYQKWLAKLRKKDRDSCVKKIEIQIHQ